MKYAKLACFALIAASLMTATLSGRADDATNKVPAAAAPAKKHGALPFHGTVAAVDAAAMTFTVGTTTIAMTSTTKITKNGLPAVFADITVGAMVRGSYKKDETGKASATLVRIGEAKKSSAAAGTNAPAMQQ
jgi:hypothetical protein